MEPGVQVPFTSDVSEAVASFGKVSEALKAATEQMTGHLAKLAGSFSNLMAPLSAFAGIVGGGALFGGAIAKANEYSGEIGRMSRVMGISMQQASGLADAVDKLGLSSGDYSFAAMRIQMQLRESDKLFVANGIAVRDLSGKMLPLNDIMMNSLARLRDMKEGYDRNELAMRLFGRSAQSLEGLIKLTSERVKDGTKSVRELGVEIGPEATARSRAYKEAMVDVHDVFNAISIRIGQEVMPRLTEMAKLFEEYGPLIVNNVISAFRALGEIASSTAVKVMLVASALRVVAVSAIPALLAQITKAVQAFQMIAAFGVEGLALYVNPWTLAILAIGAATAAIVYFMGASDRAREAQRAQATEAANNITKMDSLTEAVKRADKAYREAKDGTEEKRRREEELRNTIVDLAAVYPEFNTLLVNEEYKRIDLNKAIAETIALRRAEMQAKINAKRAERDEVNKALADQEEALRKASAEYEKFKGAALDEGGAEKRKMTSALVAMNAARDKIKGLTADAKALSDAIDTMNKALHPEAESTAGKTPAGYIDPDKLDKAHQRELALIKESMDVYRDTLEERRAWTDTYYQRAIQLAGKDKDKKLQLEIEYRKALRALDDEERKYEADMAQKRLDITRAGLDAAQQQADQLHEMGGSSDEEHLRTSITLLKRRNELEIEGLKIRRASAKTAEEQALLDEEIATATKKGETALAKLGTVSQLRTREFVSMATSAINTIQGHFSSFLSNMLRGQVSLKNAWKSLWDGLKNAAIDAFSQIVTKKIASLLIEKLAQKATALSEAEANIAVAGTGAAAAVASTPFIGPALAAAAFAETTALLTAGIAPLLASEKGFDIPAGVNPIVQLHQKETVLPAPLAEGFRNIIANGGTGGGDTYNISALDGDSVYRVLRRNASDVKRAERDNARTRRTR